MAQSDNSTVIGESILVSGTLEGDEDIIVRGRVEGTLRLTRTLYVEPTATVKAEVQVRTCVMSGAVVGNITASESVEITKEGKVVGDITAPRVIVSDGATFRGRIEIGERAAAPERPALARPAARPALRAPPPRPARAEVTAGQAGGAEEDEEEAGERPQAGASGRPPSPPVPVAVGAMKRKVIVRRK